MQRVYTTSRSSRFCGHTKVGPVLQVKVICCPDQYGIEIQAPSTSKDGSNLWIIISSGPNRYVDESWHDQDNTPEKAEMVSHISDGRPHAVISSIEETHASQPHAQSNLMNYPSKDSIQIDKKEVEGRSSFWYCRKKVSGVENFEDGLKMCTTSRHCRSRNWWSSSFCSKLRRAFQSEGARTFPDSQWLDCIHKGSNKPDFNNAQTWTTSACSRHPRALRRKDDCSWIDDSCCNSMKDGQSSCIMWAAPLPCPSYKQYSSQVEGTLKEDGRTAFLHSLRPVWRWKRRRIRW